MVLVEAQACGKPVLAGASGGTAETMIVDETGVVVDAQEPRNIADAVVALLSDSERLTQMGERSVGWVRDNFDWRALSKKAEKIFSEIAPLK